MGKTRTQAELFQTVRAFQESRTLLTAIELDIFSAVMEGAEAASVATQLGTDPDATERLLNALVGMGALLKRGQIFRCTQEAKALATGRAGLMHFVHLWETWSSLTECVRTGRPAHIEPRPSDGPADESTRALISAMHARAQEAALETVRLVQTGSARRMLDVGGGSGAFSLAFVRAHPDLQAEILDLGPVVPLAEGYIREAGLQDRVRVRPGDMLTADFGEGYDLVLLSAVCHMFGEEENRDLIARCARALAPGGQLVIREFILEEDRTMPLQATLFALNMLVGTPHGNSYTQSQYESWMEAAGLKNVRRPDPEGDVLVAEKA